MKKLIYPLVLIALVALSLSCLNSNENKNSSNDYVAVLDTTPTIQNVSSQKDTITVVAVGDMMIGTNYPSSPNYLPPNNDYIGLFNDVIPYLQDADVTFGNCEGTFSDDISYAKHCNDPQWCYRFSMPTDYVNGFVETGFDVVSIANNHVHDLGTYGREKTIETLKNSGLNFAGVNTIPSDTFTLEGVKYGFCAFAPNPGTCQITDYPKMVETVSQLDAECDIVIVSFHGGAEGSKYEHVPRTFEYFLGQNRGNVYEFAHKAIDAGADLVFGNGPHVTRSLELYNDKIIAYSLGNFLTYRRFNIQGVNGLAPIFKVWVDRDGNFIKGKLTPVYQDKFKGVFYDDQKRIIKRMQELMADDFPETELQITDDGDVLRTDI